MISDTGGVLLWIFEGEPDSPAALIMDPVLKARNPRGFCLTPDRMETRANVH
jgi:hypothetical protein